MVEEKKNINPKQKAVALKYSPEDIAPKVIAKGKGYMAEVLLEKAKENDITVYKDSALVEELNNIDLGNNIPPELYEVVAQILIFIDDLDKLEGYRKKSLE